MTQKKRSSLAKVLSELPWKKVESGVRKGKRTQKKNKK